MSVLKDISKALFSDYYVETETGELKRTLKIRPRSYLPSRRVLDPFIDKEQMWRGQMTYVILKIKKSPKKF